MQKTEDEVRDLSKKILGFDSTEHNVRQGTGQITTFNQLGFKGESKKPDGWYLPDNAGDVAIILEAKSSNEDIHKQQWAKELFDNIDVVAKKYSKIIGILYNGIEVRVFKNKIELSDISQTLEHKTYYIALYTQNTINKQHIYNVTQRINNVLHFEFGMTDLQDRMIFTACALVAQRFQPKNGLETQKGQGYDIVHNWISSKLKNSIDFDNNSKLKTLLDEYSSVRVSVKNSEAVDKFIANVCEIADLVNSDYWNGEDVMAIFFNEFNKYRGKADAGQVFTPDHITSLMYKLINVGMNDNVGDFTCGSGAFLVKAMCNMIKEAGGTSTSKAKQIKSGQLFGIELYPKVYALACANMLIHKDGKTNLARMDARTKEASSWIKGKGITKVLMNPPFERKYGCIKIVENVLDSVPTGTECAFILPDKKLEKNNGKKLLKKHCITTIIKLPENLFPKEGVTTSIFIFESGKKQYRDIIGYYIEDDGLETVKNKGRQDINNRWNAIEKYWVDSIRNGNDTKYGTKQIIDPEKNLSYQMPEKPFILYKEDFKKVAIDYKMYEDGIDSSDFESKILQKVLYESIVTKPTSNNKTSITIEGDTPDEKN